MTEPGNESEWDVLLTAVESDSAATYQQGEARSTSMMSGSWTLYSIIVAAIILVSGILFLLCLSVLVYIKVAKRLLPSNDSGLPSQVAESPNEELTNKTDASSTIPAGGKELDSSEKTLATRLPAVAHEIPGDETETDNEYVELLKRGAAFCDKGDFGDAIEVITRAIDLRPGMVEGYHLRATAYYCKRQDYKALADFSAAIRIDPGSARSLVGRSMIYLAMGKVAEAIEDSNAAIKLSPEYVHGYTSRAEALLHIGKDLDALSDIEKALQLNPGLSKAMILRGTYHRKCDNHQMAVLDYQKVLEKEPQNYEARLFLAYSYLSLKQNLNAKLEMDKAIELVPNSGECWALRGKANARMGALSESEADLTRAVTLRPEDVEFRMFLGDVFYLQHQDQKASDAYKGALDIAPQTEKFLVIENGLYLRLEKDRPPRKPE